ncbi:MAG: methionyl-tRNA formyltransferase [Candidatus Omnitrophica bacterium]|nr:methionyl-tRNA formyltransferase [Candidatus Omnitrophota bacterium]
MQIFSDWDICLLTDKKDLTEKTIKILKPEDIFFPHWSWVIPRQIYSKYTCVVFHMTDLPFGRGGSPLQNLIVRGIKRTKISAIKVEKGLDVGAVYLKRNLLLAGSATQIFTNASKIIFKQMIPYILKNNPKSLPQKGKPVVFKRRTPEQGDISKLQDLQTVYDYIRMLDAESYSAAFLETPGFKIEFINAKRKKGLIITQARITANKEKK